MHQSFSLNEHVHNQCLFSFSFLNALPFSPLHFSSQLLGPCFFCSKVLLIQSISLFWAFSDNVFQLLASQGDAVRLPILPVLHFSFSAMQCNAFRLSDFLGHSFHIFAFSAMLCSSCSLSAFTHIFCRKNASSNFVLLLLADLWVLSYYADHYFQF